MTAEVIKPIDPPTEFLPGIFSRVNNGGFDSALVEQLTAPRIYGIQKDAILEEKAMQINALDPQGKLTFLEKTFTILSNPDPSYQDQRKVGLALLTAMDLLSVDSEGLQNVYVQKVNDLYENLSEYSNLYGEIDALLEAGKLISPFIENSDAIEKVWRSVAEFSTNTNQRQIIEHIKNFKRLAGRFSPFDRDVKALADQGMSDRNIATILQVPIVYVQQAVDKFRKSGMGLPKSRGRLKPEDLQTLVEEVKNLRKEGMGNLEISKEIGVPLKTVKAIIRKLIEKGEIPKMKESGPKRKV